jgi:hypothetical protein
MEILDQVFWWVGAAVTAVATFLWCAWILLWLVVVLASAAQVMFQLIYVWRRGMPRSEWANSPWTAFKSAYRIADPNDLIYFAKRAFGPVTPWQPPSQIVATPKTPDQEN